MFSLERTNKESTIQSRSLKTVPMPSYCDADFTPKIRATVRPTSEPGLERPERNRRDAHVLKTQP